MQWADAVRKPSPKQLRQFAGLWLVVFLAMAGWRAWQGRADTTAVIVAAVAVVVGVTGLLAPALVRPIYTGWMVAAFPIGWTVSKVALGVIFFVVITPLAWVFRLTGRDLLHLRRPPEGSLWTPKRQPASPKEYLRQF
jgi:Saxitoxin biosynthesis operon protein SxtJ